MVISRRRALQRASLAIGVAVADAMKIPAFTLDKCETFSPWEWATTDLSADKPALESHGAAVKYAVLKPASTGGEPNPALVNGIPFLKDSIFASLHEGGSASLRDLDIRAKHLFLFGCRDSVGNGG
jgi:hypothetical protein